MAPEESVTKRILEKEKTKGVLTNFIFLLSFCDFTLRPDVLNPYHIELRSIYPSIPMHKLLS